MKKAESKVAIQNPVNQLIEELRIDDIGKRINAINNLHSIAQALGPERTRVELLPYLLEITDDDDSVLISMVSIIQQSSWLELMGGNNYSQFLFPILEILSKSEEILIREKASNTLKTLISNMDIKKNEGELIKLIKRLNDNKYHLTKQPVALLIPVVYKSIGVESQQELLGIFKSYVSDPNPGVRKIVSMNMCYFVKLHPVVSEGQLIGMIDPLVKDSSDQIKQFLIDAAFALIKTDVLNTNPQYIVNLIKNLTHNQSWRVKYYLCEKLGSLLAISKESFQSLFLSDYLKYLQDPEPELRSISASKINIVAGYMKTDEVISSLVPMIKELVNDTQNYVRLALAGSFLSICSLLGKKHTTDHILPIFLQLLKDDDSEIRITLFKKLNEITKVLGLDTLSQSVVPALTNLANDKNWRIRHSSIDIISFFAKEIGKEFLNEKIILIFMGWVQDQVCQVRDKAVDCVKDLITSLGSQWMEVNVLPKIMQLNSTYNHRLTILFVIGVIADQLNEDYLQKTMFPIVVQYSKDKVPNVRINVCKTLGKIHKFIKDKDTLKKIIQALKDDTDSDVQYEGSLIEF